MKKYTDAKSKDTRSLDKWIVVFSLHIVTKICNEIEEMQLTKAECQDGLLNKGITRNEYLEALSKAKDYYANFDDNILKLHKLEKSEQDFEFLIGLNQAKLRFYDQDMLKLIKF